MNRVDDTTPTWLLLAAIITVASVEFIQNGMLNFASSYVMGGVGAGPEEYSLAAMAYASTAILSLFMHTWMVERMGYRNLVLLSILVFALGGAVCGGAGNVWIFTLGRAVQGMGGATFLTAGRLLVNRREGPSKNAILVVFAYALLGGAALAPFLGEWFLRHADWRWLFWGMLPLLVLPALAALAVLPGKTVEPADESRYHPMAIGILIIFIALVQSSIQKLPFSFFGQTGVLHLVFWGALASGALFIAKHWKTTTDLSRWQALASWSYLTGLVSYFLCYFILASNSFIMPLLVQQGLGFDLLTSASLLSVTFLAAMACAPMFLWVFFKLPAPFGKPTTLIFAALSLTAFGYRMQALSPASTFAKVGWNLALNGFFLAFFICPVAMSTFRNVPSGDFGHAYQSKNIVRQLALSLAVAFSSVFLQWRNALHFNRLGERISLFNGPYQQLSGQLQAALPGKDPRLITQILTLRLQRQVAFLSCLDYYLFLQWAGLVLATLFFLRLLAQLFLSPGKPA